MRKILLVFTFCCFTSHLHAEISPDKIEVTLGPQRTVIPAGQYGLKYFPDQAVSIIQQRPILRFFVVNGNYTVLMGGKTFEKATVVKSVLEPSKTNGAYDESYTGIGGVYIKGGRIFALFHAERPTPTSFYASVGAAVSNDGGFTFRKLGPVLQGPPIDLRKRGSQGDGDPCVIVDHTKTWLYAYYTSRNRRMPNGSRRNNLTCMARSKLSDGGRPGTWKKYYRGSFSEPAIGGWDTVVAKMWAANVIYINSFKMYAMVGNGGGNEITFSEDAIHWCAKRRLIDVQGIPTPDSEVAWHARLYIIRSDSQRATGWLLYSYSPRFGNESPQSPHFFVKRAITISKAASQPRTAPEARTELTKEDGGVVEVGNVALASNGTTVTGAQYGGGLIDGKPALKYGYGKVFRSVPCILTLPKVYKLGRIRMNLYPTYHKGVLAKGWYYQYKVEVSRDGGSYEMVADCTNGEWRNWQTIHFSSRPVKNIRITATGGHPPREGIYIAEVEAYCE